MKLQHKIILIGSVLCTLSCANYSILKPRFIESLSDAKVYNTSAFDCYVFNICEIYNKKTNGSERFIKCPSNFFEKTKNDSIKKVEELYLLKHKTSNLALYFTTISYKTRPQKGFLNDSLLYNSKLYLRDVKYIYVGNVNPTGNRITFKNQKDGSKLIWHLSKNINKSSFFTVESVNAKTVENKESIKDKIVLNEVFSVPFAFNKENYAILNTKNEQELITKLFLVENKKMKTAVIFKLNDSLALGYKFSHRKVLYAR